jgi:hypothetical protein
MAEIEPKLSGYGFYQFGEFLPKNYQCSST